jgi:zinc transport system substrate-binding protein
MVRLAQSRVYFTIGVPFEKQFVGRVAGTFADVEIVDTQEGVALRTMVEPHHHGDESGHNHDHDQDHEEAAGSSDPHIWLDPKRVMIQARTMCGALQRLDPSHAEEFGRNLAAFETDLMRLDAKLAASLAPLKGHEFFVFHPAFGYFADAYGLIQVPVETGGKEPGPRQLAALIERARNSRVQLIFVQQQFAASSAEAIAKAIGGAVIRLDPLPRDYIRDMEAMAAEIAESLGAGIETRPDSRPTSAPASSRSGGPSA